MKRAILAVVLMAMAMVSCSRRQKPSNQLPASNPITVTQFDTQHLTVFEIVDARTGNHYLVVEGGSYGITISPPFK